MKKFKCTQSFLWRYNQFVTLGTRRELEPKCVPQLFLGLLLWTRRSAIGHFFRLLSNNPRSLCESLHYPVFLSFLKCRKFRRKSISPVFLLFDFQSVSGHFPYLTLPKPVMPLNKWVLFTQCYFYLIEKKRFDVIGGEFGRLKKAGAVTNPELLPKRLTDVMLQLFSY